MPETLSNCLKHRTDHWVTIKQLQVFCNVIMCHWVSSSQCFKWTCYHSSWTLDPWMWRWHAPSKHQEPFMQNHCLSHPRRLESISPILASPGKWRHFDKSKQQEITQYHSITSQEDFILKSHMNHHLCNCSNYFSANNLYALLQILNQAGRTYTSYSEFWVQIAVQRLNKTECSVCRHTCQDSTLGTWQMMAVT